MSTFISKLTSALLVISAGTTFAQSEIPPALEGMERYGNFKYFPSTPKILYLTEAISRQQAISFRKAVLEHEIDTLVLDSPGGDVESGLNIAGIIHDREIATFIPDNGVCASACSYIFLAGQNRILSNTAALGVHQFAPSRGAKRDSLEVFSEVQSVMGDVYGVISSFGVPPFVITKMLDTTPDDMYYFRDDQLEEIARGSVTAAMDEAQNLINTLDSFVANLKQATQEPERIAEPNPTRKSPPNPIIYATQTALNLHGCRAGTPDGIFGPKSNAALNRFIKATGRPRNAFEKTSAEDVLTLIENTKAPACGQNISSPTSNQIIADIQTALNVHGCAAGPVNGIANQQTTEAIARFVTATKRPAGSFDGYSNGKVLGIVCNTTAPVCQNSQSQPTANWDLSGQWKVVELCWGAGASASKYNYGTASIAKRSPHLYEVEYQSPQGIYGLFVVDTVVGMLDLSKSERNMILHSKTEFKQLTFDVTMFGDQQRMNSYRNYGSCSGTWTR